MKFGGDMKGLMQLLGHAGPNATYYCIFCLAKLGRTNMAGVPHLRRLPPGHTELRSPEEADPPARTGTRRMREVGQACLDAFATGAATSSAAYESISNVPMVDSDDLLGDLTGMPLHVTLGAGTDELKRAETTFKGYDAHKILIDGAGGDANLLAKHAALKSERDAKAKLEEDHAATRASKEAAMAICVDHDSKADNTRRKLNPEKDEHAWAIKWRATKAEKDVAEKARKKAADEVTKLEKKMDEVAEEMLKYADDDGPFMTAFKEFLKEVGVDIKKYFGGTYIGPDLEKILRDPERIKKLCALHRARVFYKPVTKEPYVLGDDALAEATVKYMLPFAEMHKMYNRKEPLCEHEIAKFPQLVEAYAVAFAEAHPDLKPTPKQHLLCYHFHEILGRHGSTGMDTEQGVESAHPEISHIRSHFRAQDRQQEAQLASIADQCYARNGGKRAMSEAATPLKAAKHARTEKAREQHKFGK